MVAKHRTCLINAICGEVAHTFHASSTDVQLRAPENGSIMFVTWTKDNNRSKWPIFLKQESRMHV